MASLQEIYSQAPNPEEFGFDASLYKRLESEKKELEARNTESRRVISSIEDNAFIRIFLFLCGLVCWGMGYGLVFFIATSFFLDGPFEWIGIMLIIVALYGSLGLPFWIEEKLGFSGGVYNFFTFGKYRKALLDSEVLNKKIEALTEGAKRQVSNFEEALYDYFQGAVERFYLNNLYKKKSGTEKFEESLSEFNAMLTDLSSANDFLLTKKFRLAEYESYLIGRSINHSIQQNKPSTVREKTGRSSFSERARNAVVKTEILPPEQTYRVPRKIDWEKLNKAKALTGAKGEEIVVAIEEDYLRSVGRDDLAKNIQNIAKDRGDGSGYDILSFFSNGQEKYIEVKTTVKSFEVPYYLSRNELSFLNAHPNDSFIYRILISENFENEHNLEIQTVKDILEESSVIPVNYLVKKK